MKRNNHIEINNIFKKEISNQKIKDVLKITWQTLKKKKFLPEDKILDLSIALIPEKKMIELNEKYRKQVGSTDVLSFCYDNKDKKVTGELILSPEVIKRFAKEDKKDFKRELNKNLIHGLLHIVGFKHGRKMFNLQQNILLGVNKYK